MSSHTDRPGKLLFGCLIVVLCWIIGAGQFLDGTRPDDRAAQAVDAEGVRQAHATSPSNASTPARGSNAPRGTTQSQAALRSPLALTSLRWALQHEPQAFYCFLGAVVLWIASVVTRQFVLMNSESPDGSNAETRHEISPLWRLFDLLVAIAIVACAGVIIVRELGGLFALLITVTTIVCYFLAYGPRHIAEYFADLFRWLDQHYASTTVNGDLPLGRVRPSLASSLYLPATWWKQRMQHEDEKSRAVPVGVVVFGMGMLVALALVGMLGGSGSAKTPDTRSKQQQHVVQAYAEEPITPGRKPSKGTIELAPIDDEMTELGEMIMVTPKLRDPAHVQGDIEFSLGRGSPEGTHIDPETGVITWRPTELGTHTITVRVQSDAPGRPSDQQTFKVIVEPSKRLPELADIGEQAVHEGEPLSIRVKLNNKDRLKSPVRFTLTAGRADGAKIDPATGVITWKTARAGTYPMTVRAMIDTPGAVPVEKRFNVVVRGSVRGPELVDIDDKVLKEGQPLRVVAKVRNSSQHQGSLQFSLSDDSPEGASIDSDTGLLAWTPTRAGSYTISVIAKTDARGVPPSQKSFTVEVEGARRAPVLAKINDQSIDEGEPLVVPVRVKDPGSPRGDLRFSLGADSPRGMDIDPDSGTIEWTPNSEGTHRVTVQCVSEADLKLVAKQTFSVIVHGANQPPELEEIGNKIVRAGDTLLVNVEVKDPGRPAGDLHFSLAPNAPTGARIQPNAGVVTWTPTDEQAGEHEISVRARNATRPTLADEVTFEVHVLGGNPTADRIGNRGGERFNERPQPLAASSSLDLLPIHDQTVEPGTAVTFIARTRNAAGRAGPLEYSLGSGAPDGADIDQDSGVFKWRPTADDAGKRHSITVRVRDADDETRHDEGRFTVTVTRDGDEAAPTARPRPMSDPDDDADWRPSPVPLDRAPEQQKPRHHRSNDDDDVMPREPLDDDADLYSNAIGMKLVGIQDGVFMMGSHESAEQLAAADVAESSRFKDELPQHAVRITRPFLMGKFEVTVGQFRQFVHETGYKTEAEKDGQGAFSFNADAHDFTQSKQANWQNTGWTQTNDHPVVNVSWNDAVAFCHWLSKKDGHQYRLPTEAEWEYACRAGSDTRYSSGDDEESLQQVGNLGDESFRQIVRPGYSKVVQASAQQGHAFTTPAGKFQSNAFGLCDMHGNAFEWCHDWYDAKYYAQSPDDDPRGPDSGEKRLIRGGSFYNAPFYCRSSFRNGFPPATRVPYLGFRVVMDLDDEPATRDEPARLEPSRTPSPRPKPFDDDNAVRDQPIESRDE